MAQTLGYTPLLADAHKLPLMHAFADIVALNATLHHCEDMPQVLREAARLVRPGGLLVIDHDPQLSAWNYKGLGIFFYQIRLWIYRLVLRNLHIHQEERSRMLATEIHHQPGDGVTADLFRQTLAPLGFVVHLYPHNHTVGAEALQGQRGRPPTGAIVGGRFSPASILILQTQHCRSCVLQCNNPKELETTFFSANFV